MLPAALFSAYQQYKQDTDSVASWLASTAKECGYPADLLATGRVPQKSQGRLKGKARKEAKKQAQASEPAHQATAKHIIAMKDFVPLAEFISASQKPLISVPLAFSETINRVISARAIFGTRMTETGVEANEESDSRHSYFVKILEKVREALRARMSTEAEKVPYTAPTATTSKDLSNRFAALRIYEPSQEFLNAPDIKRPENAAGDKSVYEAEPHTSFEDALMAFTMIISDINKIRSRISWIWANHSSGLFEAANAAVATNTAIELARNIIDQVVPLCKPHGGVCAVADKYFVLRASQCGSADCGSIEMQMKTWGKRAMSNEHYELADQAFFNANRLMRKFVGDLSPNTLPLYRSGVFGVYDATSDRTLKTGHQKFIEDKIVLAEIFFEAVNLIRLVPKYPVEDELIRGLKELDKTGELPFYAVFAAQIHIDIHHQLRELVPNALVVLMKQISTIQSNVKSHLEFHKDLRIDHWPPSNDKVLRDFIKSIDWFIKDPVYVAKMKAAQKFGTQMEGAAEQYRLLKYSPILSGLCLYHFRAEVYGMGIAIANAWGSIAYSAHLYNALQRENLIEKQWKDMDVTQHLLGDTNFFVGNRPQNPAEYLKRFCLQMGVSASVLTPRNEHFKRSRNTSRQALESRAGPRGIKEGVPVSRMFMDRYVNGTGQVKWTPENIDEIIKRSRYGEDESGEKPPFMMSELDHPRGKNKKNKKPAQIRPMAEGGQLTPERLVKLLTMAMMTETLAFAFPYILMHRWAWKLLRTVKTHCDPLLREIHGPTYMEQESELPYVVGYIFLALNGGNDGQRDDRLLRQAAVAMSEMTASAAGTLVLGVAHKFYGLEVMFDDDGAKAE